MGKLGSAVWDGIKGIADAVIDVVAGIWQDVIAPALETIFGIFGIVDEDVVTVQKVSVPVLDDGNIDLHQNALANTVIGMGKNNAGFYKNYLLNTSKNKLQMGAYYKYGKSGYVNGLPEATVSGNNVDFEAIDSALNDAVDGTNLRLSVNATFPSDEVWFKHELQSTHNYKPYDNTLTAEDEEGVEHTDWYWKNVAFNTVDMDFDITIGRTTEEGEVTTVIKKPNFIKKRCLVVTYHNVQDDPSKWFYWVYVLENNVYPGIEPQITLITNLDMLPVAIIRKNKQFITEEQNIAEDLYEEFGRDTDIFRTTNLILKKLGMTVDDAIEAIASNPDIDLIDDAYINFAMSPTSDAPVISKLLYLHFEKIVVEQGFNSNVDEYTATFEEQDVNNALAWSKNIYKGKQLIANASYTRSYISSLPIGGYGHHIGAPHLFIVKRVSETEYDEIQVNDLAGMSAISYDGYHNVAFTKVDDENFTIPISWYLVNQLKGKEVLEAFPHVFRFDVYSIDVQELAWYQQSIFKVIVQIAIIIIAIYTGGAASWLEALVQVIFTVAVTQIAIYIAELTGNEYIAAAVAIIAAFVIGDISGISFDVTAIDGLVNVVTTFSNSLAGAQEGVLNNLKDDLDDLLAEYDDLLEEQNENSVYSSQVGGAEFVHMISPDTQLFLGRDIQYQFDMLYDYNNFLYGYIENQLNTSII
ncbi:hypothetical protein vBAmePPT11V19_00025 [Alteromonas phage vB_AmeP_PT11-V19]|nr:hypothetical protein vBAmePPT11V19_00025 [Alteromonas phage vB_AmeP_PT11-V19]